MSLDSAPPSVILITADELPPEQLVDLVRPPEGTVVAQSLRTFFAELDAGCSAPDALVVIGEVELMHALRRDDRIACKPIFQWGSRAHRGSGWDGALVQWNPAMLEQVQVWRQAEKNHPDPDLPADLPPSERRFLRFLATRGTASLSSIQAFGVDAVEVAIGHWLRQDRVVLATVERLVPTPELLEELTPALEPEPEPEEATSEEDYWVGASSATRSAPSAHAPPVRARRFFGIRDLLLLAVLAAVVADLWSRYGYDYFYPDAVQKPLEVMELPPQLQVIEVEVPAAEKPLPELVLDAELHWDRHPISAAFDGTVEWRWQTPHEVKKGDVVGSLVRMALTDGQHRARLQDRLQEMEDEIAGLQEEEDQSLVEHRARSLEAMEEARLAQETSASRLRKAQAIYDRVKALADEGVLSYREIRGDWDQLQIAETAHAEAKLELQRATETFESAQGLESEDIAQDPVWVAQASALRLQLEGSDGEALRVPLVAEVDGLLEMQWPNGMACPAGQPLATILPLKAAHVEAVMATEDWDSRYLKGVARLRPESRSSWMPTRILSAESLPDGLTHLRLRIPVGWLDGGGSLTPDRQPTLEIRLTAPHTTVEEES